MRDTFFAPTAALLEAGSAPTAALLEAGSAPTAALREADLPAFFASSLFFRPMQPEDLMAIDVQDSQATFLGQDAMPDEETALQLAANPVAWTAYRRDESVLACFGFNEAFPGQHGTAWALIGKGIGSDHLALTRFVRKVVAGCTLPRLDVLARAKDVRPGSFNPIAESLAEPTPECRWCVMLGFKPAHLLRKFGAAGETYMMFERIRERAQ